MRHFPVQDCGHVIFDHQHIARFEVPVEEHNIRVTWHVDLKPSDGELQLRKRLQLVTMENLNPTFQLARSRLTSRWWKNQT